MRRIGIAVLAVVFLAVAGCATRPADPDLARQFDEINDPWEPVNRGIFAFNGVLDAAVVKPLAVGYRFITPQFVRTGVSNFFENLRTPMYLANDLMQADGAKACDSLRRLLVNTTIGVGGLFDPASHWDIPKKDNDFGRTLAVWGVERGPYFVRPFFGASTIRDAAGWGVDLFLIPTDYLILDQPEIYWSKAALYNISEREQAIEFIENLQRSSTDMYVTVRSLYLQNRTKEIAAARGEKSAPGYAFEFDTDD
ncbi:MAG: VacJ family lipoprotein [Alphaproteobacteria bacterium]|nr:VacJ family lipoprotein [Alphaproteobacteria bacterium]